MALDPSPEKRALVTAAEVFKSKSGLAKALGMSKQGIHPYFHTSRPFPAELCPTVERLTREQGSAVLCEELRPDVEWSVLRHKPRRAKAA